MRHFTFLVSWLSLFCFFVNVEEVNAFQAEAEPLSVTRAVLRYRELMAKRTSIRRNLKDAEVASIRAVIREGPRDEFETEEDFEKRLRENDRKRAEIAGRYLLIERDTLLKLETELGTLSALRFSPNEFEMELGPYDINTRRYARVYLRAGLDLQSVRRQSKKKKPTGLFVLEAIGQLAIIPDDARTFREHEEDLQIDPMIRINDRGNLAFLQEIRVKEPESGKTALITECRPASYTSPSTGIKLVYLPAGSFKMGSQFGDDDEKPVHEVIISKGFFMAETEITQKHWQTVMQTNPSFFSGENRPVENITYEMAQEFVKRLNELEKTTTYRLPTEAEWEYACRAGKQTEWTFGTQEAVLSSFAWHYENSSRQTHLVAQKSPNAWGLYDMHGNVWEWVSDWYGADYYRVSERSNPIGPVKGDYRVLRGGSWNGRASYSRSANRFPNYPGVPDKEFGFRIIKLEE